MDPVRIVRLVEDGLKRLLAGLVPARHPATRAVRAGQEPVAAPVAASLLKAEVEALPRDQRLVESGQYLILYARASQIPWCLQEIGRPRELTFRAAGEGTGKASDIDLFDGERGLYTRSLVSYGSRLLRTLNPAIELGRSFVRAENQRSFFPLLALWRGIGQFILRSPRYAVLFGPVSISNSYAPVSRQLMVDYLSANNSEARLARHMRPRRPFRVERSKVRNEIGIADLRDVEHLSRVIARIEHDNKGVPILLKQYLKLGGRLLGFSSDDQFSDALDGLVVVF